MIVVIDTNVLLVSISERSKHHWIYKSLIDNKYELAVSNEILNEYEEKIGEHWHPNVAKTVIRTLLELPNVKLINIYYNFNLITADPDDNKFVDCAVAANAAYLVSNDRDFDVMKTVEFPKLAVINAAVFKEKLEQ
ncbi:MAG: putative toxin-antitoxin system toxin component, PIN family [Saprospiraceae bacterium]